ncbi:MAG: hypothetical protein HY293_20245 [Planctomycetes bacterium]|nr:hypothetical protein [Planctomycetota bacterium]
MRFLALALPVILSLAPQDDLDSRLDAFSKQIIPGSDPVAARFQKALPTRAGRIVLRDRIEKAAEALRAVSERDAVPEYFQTRFEEVGGAYRLRKGQEEFRRHMVDDYKASKADIERLRPVIKEVADNLADTPEINAKLKKYLSHPGTVEFFYLGDLRQKSRPDIYVILKKLGELFAQTEDGKFYIPDARQDVAEKFCRLGGALMDASRDVSAQLGAVCEKLATIDELHQRLKKAGADPLFACVLLKKSIDNADINDIEPSIQKLRGASDELARKLPEVFEPTPNGKVLVEKAYTQVSRSLDAYDQARAKVAVLREPGRQLAVRLRAGDERTETFRKMLQSDAVLALLDIDVGGEEADPVKYVLSQIRKAVSKDADGKYRVLPEVAEHLDNEIKDPVRTAEREDRAFKIVSMYGEKIEDKELREIFTSRYGKFEVERTMKELLSIRSYDGLKTWTERHFEKSAAGVTLKASSKGEIESILSEIEKLEKESRKNDLKD